MALPMLTVHEEECFFDMLHYMHLNTLLSSYFQLDPIIEPYRPGNINASLVGENARILP